MIKELLQKLIKFVKSKPESGCPPVGPDPDENTFREVPTKNEENTHWVNIFKIKF